MGKRWEIVVKHGHVEVALKAGSDIVRVGTGIFRERPKKSGAN